MTKMEEEKIESQQGEWQNEVVGETQDMETKKEDEAAEKVGESTESSSPSEEGE